MAEAFICDALRTPFGRYGGSLASVRADDLGAVPIRALLARHPGLDPAAIEAGVRSRRAAREASGDAAALRLDLGAQRTLRKRPTRAAAP